MREATVDGRNPAPVDVVVSPIIYRVFYTPGGAGFLPSTVWSQVASRIGRVWAQWSAGPVLVTRCFVQGRTTRLSRCWVWTVMVPWCWKYELWGKRGEKGHPKWWFVAMAYYAQKKHQNGYYMTKQFENQCFIHCLWILCVSDCFPCVFDGDLYTIWVVFFFFGQVYQGGIPVTCHSISSWSLHVLVCVGVRESDSQTAIFFGVWDCWMDVPIQSAIF